MRTSSDYRADARAKLSGKWGKAALISLGYFVVFFALGVIEGLMSGLLKSIFSIAVAIIEIPLVFGVIFSYYRLFNGEDTKAFDFLQSGFSNFKRSWLVGLNVAVKMLVPIIVVIVGIALLTIGVLTYGFALLVIGGIVYFVGLILSISQSYYYQLANLVAIDNEELSNKNVVYKCREIMQGKRGKLFCLQFSFIGWAILTAFSFGIGLLWLVPYIQFSMISFYKDAIGENDEVIMTN